MSASMSQSEQPQQALSDILESGARLAARRVLVFIRITAPLILPVNAVFIPVVVWLAKSSGSRNLAIGVLVPVVVVYVIAVVLSTGACVRAAAEAHRGAEPNAKAALEYVFRRPIPIFCLTLLLCITAVPAFAMVVLPGLTALGSFALLLIALALVSLWLSGTLAVSLPAMVVEEKGVTGSLRRSAALVRGSLMRAIGTVVLGGILALFAGVLIALLVSIFSLGGENVILVVTLVGTALGELFVAPLFAAFLVVLYYDLCARERIVAAYRAQRQDKLKTDR